MDSASSSELEEGELPAEPSVQVRTGWTSRRVRHLTIRQTCHPLLPSSLVFIKHRGVKTRRRSRAQRLQSCLAQFAACTMGNKSCLLHEFATAAFVRATSVRQSRMHAWPPHINSVFFPIQTMHRRGKRPLVPAENSPCTQTVASKPFSDMSTTYPSWFPAQQSAHLFSARAAPFVTHPRTLTSATSLKASASTPGQFDLEQEYTEPDSPYFPITARNICQQWRGRL